MQYLGKESAGNRWWSNYRFWDPITRCLASRMELKTYSRQEGISHVDEEKYRQVWVAGGEGRISRLKDTDIKCRRSQPYLKAFCMGLSKPLPQTLSWNLLLLSLTRTCVTPELLVCPTIASALINTVYYPTHLPHFLFTSATATITTSSFPLLIGYSSPPNHREQKSGGKMQV